MKFLRFFVFLPFLVLQSWLILFRDGFYWIVSAWKRREFLFKLGIVLSLAEAFFSVRPWLAYSVQFLDAPELVQVSGKLNLVFFLLAFLSFYSITVSESKHALRIHLTTQGLIFVLFAGSFFFQNTFLHDFQNPGDYNLTQNFYFFGISAQISLLLGFRIYQKFQPL